MSLCIKYPNPYRRFKYISVKKFLSNSIQDMAFIPHKTCEYNKLNPIKSN